MQRKVITCLFAAFFMMAVSVPAVLAQSLTIMTEDYPPLNYLEAGEAKGASVDIVKLILERLGEKSTVRVLPWARAYMLTQHSENHVLFSMTRIESREDLFKWVGPLAVKRHAFYLRRDSGISLNSPSDARSLTIGVQLDGVDQDYLVKHGFDNLDGISNWQQNANKLLAGRIDVWLASTVSANEVIDDFNLTGQIVETVEVFQRPLYIAFNLKTPDDVIARWQAVRDELYKDGTARAIFEAHDQLALLPDE